MNDVVVLFYGADYPLVIRKQQDGRYMIAGDCYLDGYMDGEGLSDSHEETAFVI